MCKLIAELTGADKEVLRETITNLELASGAPGVDVRLTAEIHGKVRMKMRELGLDPADTTPTELYHALLNITVLHDRFIANRLGISPDADSEHVLKGVVQAVNKMQLPTQTWALKAVAAKRLLKSVPPKNLMKLLHYRSVSSLLKREPAALIMTAAHHTESSLWQRRIKQAYKGLKPNDFETRPIGITYIDLKRWQFITETWPASKQTAIFYSLEMGYIAVLPVAKRSHAGLTLVSLLAIMHDINEIRMYSTLLKFHHLQADFGIFLADTVSREGDLFHAKLGQQTIEWPIIHQYYGRTSGKNHPEIFEPHIQPEDLSYRKAEEVLYRLEPALHFWHGNDYVGLAGEDKPISFNLSDMALNLLNNVPYDQRLHYHLRDSLWNELFIRYLSQPTLERQLLRQLDEQIMPEPAIALEMEFAW